ncbi:cell cycle checkpoint control protein RAD9B isoform X3 [Paralichthys olivaceus]|uniref:cell cycle checkpoint control protein RAD9B isoform X3 n=1 Tax=Paralichthys olivaceus TaxID=8255 RepID=UPI0037518F94
MQTGHQVLPLFRCLAAIERNVERCQISISTPTDRVIIQFFCRHGITKTHNLRFQESEALQAEFSSHLCPNVLKAPARVLSDMVLHFPVSLEEITLSATPLRVTLRNYHEAGNDHMKMMHTEMSLHPDEFDFFQVGVDSDVTFCLKELRGFLSFAESHCLPVSIYFTAAGKPVCFSMEDMVLEATVVLATLIDSENKGPSQPVDCTAPTSPRFTDVAALPVVSHEVDSRESQNAPAVAELIPSSQGSPIINQPALMHLPSSDHPDRRDVPDEASAMATPASSMVTRASCWFLIFTGNPRSLYPDTVLTCWVASFTHNTSPNLVWLTKTSRLTGCVRSMIFLFFIKLLLMFLKALLAHQEEYLLRPVT